MEFRQANKCGYKYVKEYRLEIINLPDGVTKKQLRRNDDGTEQRIVVPQSELFDAIYSAHVSASHMKVDITWNKCKQSYYNITYLQVKLFISTCNTCASGKPRIKVLKGAKKPILSEAFRDRFQIDLIDMTKKGKEHLRCHDEMVACAQRPLHWPCVCSSTSKEKAKLCCS